MPEKPSTSEVLLSSGKAAKPLRGFIGFDGFIDEIVHVVESRTDVNNYTRIKTIGDYARRIMGGSGLSTNIEVVNKMRKLGGNGPNFAVPLRLLGMDLVYVGTVGSGTGECGSFDPVFEEFGKSLKLIGLADPGRSQCFEFDDGKIIVSRSESLSELTPDKLTESIGKQQLLDMLSDADLIAMNNWTMLPYMSEIWEMLLADYVPEIKKRCDLASKVIFVDIADPEKRSRDDIRRALDILGRYTEAGFRTVLGLNKKEGCEIAEVFGKKIEDYAGHPLEDICRFDAEHLNLTCLIVHPVDRAASMTGGVFTETPGPYCEKPLLTTGAGDNFNAGYIFGYLNGFSQEDCLRCGVGTSGFYVRNARSPELQELAEFLKTF